MSDPSLVPDAELARRAAAGELAAFQALYERHADLVFRFLVRLTGDATLAEDLLQEAFFKVHANLGQRDQERSFRAWLYQVARNAALDALRARRKERRMNEGHAREAETRAEDVLATVVRGEEAERARAVSRALETLPDEPRTLLVQRHLLGLPLDELAESWSVTERTVRTRLHDAATLLAQAIRTLRHPGGRT